MNAPPTTVLPVDGGHVSWTDSGGPGPAVLLVHAAIFSDWFVPLTAEPALADHRLVRIVRAGYGSGPAPERSLSIGDHAAHCAALLDALHVDRTVVVGHSSGSAIAMQLAMDRPDLVAGLVLGEPPLVDALAAPEDLETLYAALGPVFGVALAAMARGAVAVGFDALMRLLCGAGYHDVLSAALGPDGVERATAESPYFAGEGAAAGAWEFDSDRARLIHQPVLLVQGGASIPATHRMVARLADMLPDARVATIDGDDHLLPLRSPAALAGLVAEFARA